MDLGELSVFSFILYVTCIMVAWSLVDLNPGFHLGVFVSNLVQKHLRAVTIQIAAM